MPNNEYFGTVMIVSCCTYAGNSIESYLEGLRIYSQVLYPFKHHWPPFWCIFEPKIAFLRILVMKLSVH